MTTQHGLLSYTSNTVFKRKHTSEFWQVVHCTAATVEDPAQHIKRLKYPYCQLS